MSIHTMQSRVQALLSRKALSLLLVLAFLYTPNTPLLGQGIAPGGCVLGGRGASRGFVLARNSTANARTQELKTAFFKVGNDMNRAMSAGDLVSAFRHYLVYADNAETYRNDLPTISRDFLETRNRITIVLNYAVTNAMQIAAESPDNSIALMTLIEVANMQELGAPSQLAIRFLELRKDSPSYKTTLAQFTEKYQLENLAPEATNAKKPVVEKAAKKQKAKKTETVEVKK